MRVFNDFRGGWCIGALMGREGVGITGMGGNSVIGGGVLVGGGSRIGVSSTCKNRPSH